MLSKHTIDALLGHVYSAQRQLDTYKPSTQLYHLESRYTLFRLSEILKFRYHDTESALVSFLKCRADIVKSRDIHYLHDFVNPANMACISVARELSRIRGTPYLGLLMPSLLDISTDSYLTSSYSEDVLLPDIILSDCNTRIIHIRDVLDCSQDDGWLKHNSLFLGEIKKLSPSEINRFLSRDKTIQDTYDALLSRVNFKLYGDTVGAALKRLIQSLRAGGVKAKGLNVDYDSGREANEGILVFHEYLETLDPEIRLQLMSASKFDRYRPNQPSPETISIGMLWQQLARPKEANYADSTYCVELTADGLEEVLAENPGLYELVSYSGGAAASLSDLNAAVTATKKVMDIALPTLQKHACYGDAKNDELCIELAGIFEARKDFVLDKDDIVYFVKQFYAFIARKDPSVIGSLLKHIRASYKSALIYEALAEVTREERRAFIHLTGYGVTPFWQKPTSAQAPTADLPRNSKRKSDDLLHDEGPGLKRPWGL